MPLLPFPNIAPMSPTTRRTIPGRRPTWFRAATATAHGLRLRRSDRVDRILEVSKQQLLMPRYRDLASLAKHREVVGVPSDGLEPRHSVRRRLAIRLTELKERKSEGGQEQSDQIEGERRRKSVVHLVARRGAEQVEEELPVVWIEHRGQAPRPRWMSATIVCTVRHR